MAAAGPRSRTANGADRAEVLAQDARWRARRGSRGCRARSGLSGCRRRCRGSAEASRTEAADGEHRPRVAQQQPPSPPPKTPVVVWRSGTRGSRETGEVSVKATSQELKKLTSARDFPRVRFLSAIWVAAARSQRAVLLTGLRRPARVLGRGRRRGADQGREPHAQGRRRLQAAAPAAGPLRADRLPRSCRPDQHRRRRAAAGAGRKCVPRLRPRRQARNPRPAGLPAGRIAHAPRRPGAAAAAPTRSSAPATSARHRSSSKASRCKAARQGDPLQRRRVRAATRPCIGHAYTTIAATPHLHRS